MKSTFEKSKTSATSDEINSVAQSIDLYDLAALFEEFNSVQSIVSSEKVSALAAFLRSTFVQSIASLEAGLNCV